MSGTSTPVTGQTTPSTPRFEFNTWAFVIQSLLQEMQTATLVQVISCSNANTVSPWGTVTVQPLVFQMTGARQAVPHGELCSVPYFRIQGGKNAIIMDPEPGDIGIAVFCSRDISNVKADPVAAVKAGGATPGSFAQFDWADGLYLGGFLNGTPLQYVLFALAGVSIVSPTAITLEAPEVTITAPVVAINALTSVTITSPIINLVGAVNQSAGAVVIDGAISGTSTDPATFAGDVQADGTSLISHKHPGQGTLVAGSTPVTGDTGAPI
jgi:hypothetical protein